MERQETQYGDMGTPLTAFNDEFPQAMVDALAAPPPHGPVADLMPPEEFSAAVYMSALESLTPPEDASEEASEELTPPEVEFPAGEKEPTPPVNDDVPVINTLNEWKQGAVDEANDAFEKGDTLTNRERHAPEVHQFKGSVMIDQLYALDMATPQDPSPLRSAIDRGRIAVGRHLAASAILIEAVTCINELL